MIFLLFSALSLPLAALLFWQVITYKFLEDWERLLGIGVGAFNLGYGLAWLFDTVVK